MNETLKQAMAAFVQDAMSAARAGATWSAEQAPMLVQEWLRWQVVGNTLWTAIFAALTVVLARTARWCWTQFMADKYSDWIFGAVMALIGTVMVFIAMVNGVFSLLKVLVAPRVVVLEKLADLIK